MGFSGIFYRPRARKSYHGYSRTLRDWPLHSESVSRRGTPAGRSAGPGTCLRSAVPSPACAGQVTAEVWGRGCCRVSRTWKVPTTIQKLYILYKKKVHSKSPRGERVSWDQIAMPQVHCAPRQWFRVFRERPTPVRIPYNYEDIIIVIS